VSRETGSTTCSGTQSECASWRSASVATRRAASGEFERRHVRGLLAGQDDGAQRVERADAFEGRPDVPADVAEHPHRHDRVPQLAQHRHAVGLAGALQGSGRISRHSHESCKGFRETLCSGKNMGIGIPGHATEA
jgi:hypothetical protein